MKQRKLLPMKKSQLHSISMSIMRFNFTMISYMTLRSALTGINVDLTFSPIRVFVLQLLSHLSRPL